MYVYMYIDTAKLSYKFTKPAEVVYECFVALQLFEGESPRVSPWESPWVTLNPFSTL